MPGWLAAAVAAAAATTTTDPWLPRWVLARQREPVWLHVPGVCACLCACTRALDLTRVEDCVRWEAARMCVCVLCGAAACDRGGSGPQYEAGASSPAHETASHQPLGLDALPFIAQVMLFVWVFGWTLMHAFLSLCAEPHEPLGLLPELLGAIWLLLQAAEHPCTRPAK